MTLLGGMIITGVVDSAQGMDLDMEQDMVPDMDPGLHAIEDQADMEAETGDTIMMMTLTTQVVLTMTIPI